MSSTGKRRLSNGPRVCELCNKAFKYPSDLKKHLQIHTGKFIECLLCTVDLVPSGRLGHIL